jgi:hypothetical protein
LVEEDAKAVRETEGPWSSLGDEAASSELKAAEAAHQAMNDILPLMPVAPNGSHLASTEYDLFDGRTKIRVLAYGVFGAHGKDANTIANEDAAADRAV